MSQQDHKGHDENGHSHDDGHHDHVPAHATEIVPEKSPEDYTLFGLIVACTIFLMAGIGSWSTIEKPSGGGHGHEGVHEQRAESDHGSHIEHAEDGGAHNH